MPTIHIFLVDYLTRTTLQTYGDVTDEELSVIMERAPNVTYQGKRYPADVKVLTGHGSAMMREDLEILPGQDWNNSPFNLIELILKSPNITEPIF